MKGFEVITNHCGNNKISALDCKIAVIFDVKDVYGPCVVSRNSNVFQPKFRLLTLSISAKPSCTGMKL